MQKNKILGLFSLSALLITSGIFFQNCQGGFQSRLPASLSSNLASGVNAPATLNNTLPFFISLYEGQALNLTPNLPFDLSTLQSISWSINGQVITSAAGQSVLNLTSSASQQGVVEISFTQNLQPYTITVAQLSVLPQTKTQAVPSIVVQPMAALQTLGLPVNLSTAFLSYPQATVQWYFNGAQLSGATNSYLALPALNQSNQGEYYAVITNSVGQVQTQTVLVQDASSTFVPAQILSPIANVSITAGADLNIKVQVAGSPAPTITWFFNSTAIPTATGSTLTIPAVTPTNGGNYSVQVQNANGVNPPVTVLQNFTVTVSCPANSSLQGGSCIANACTPNSTSSCTASNGAGTQTCNAQGSALGPCILSSCDLGYTLSGGNCVINCIPGSKTYCDGTGGMGINNCNAQGTGYTTCVFNVCYKGYYLQGGQCLPGLCAPGNSIYCSSSSGYGTQVCNATSTAYSACNYTACAPGYYLQGGQCLPGLCAPNSTSACSSANGSGTQTCNAAGTAYSACVNTTCATGYNLQSGNCVANVCTPNFDSLSCTIGNGVGAQICNAQGSGYGPCNIYGCVAGYALQGGTCVFSCKPNEKNYCFEGNGVGDQVCNAAGTAYGPCTLTNCNPGYNLQGTTCVSGPCAANSTSSCGVGIGAGTQVCNATGTAYGACTFTSCGPGYYLQAGNCIAGTCAPNSTASCTSGGGTGTHTCNAVGTGYGTCTLSSCSPGFNLQSGNCVMNVCTPSATSVCGSGGGTGTQICNAQGSGYGDCTISSCYAGYNMQNGACVLNVCTPGQSYPYNDAAGVGERICNAQGTGWGPTQYESCGTGYFLQGTSCLAQVCSPEQNQVCNAGGGPGFQTCAWDGSGWSTCASSSCSVLGQTVLTGNGISVYWPEEYSMPCTPRTYSCINGVISPTLPAQVSLSPICDTSLGLSLQTDPTTGAQICGCNANQLYTGTPMRCRNALQTWYLASQTGTYTSASNCSGSYKTFPPPFSPLQPNVYIASGPVSSWNPASFVDPTTVDPTALIQLIDPKTCGPAEPMTALGGCVSWFVTCNGAQYRINTTYP